MERWKIVEKLVKNKLLLKRGAEVGVNRGHTAKYLLRKFSKLKLYCVDPYKKYDDYAKFHDSHSQEEYDNRFKEVKKSLPGRAIFIRKMGKEAAAEVPDKSLDFVFWDANHIYEYVCDDIRNWKAKIRDGGLFIGWGIDSNKTGGKSVRDAVIDTLGGYECIERCWYRVL